MANINLISKFNIRVLLLVLMFVLTAQAPVSAQQTTPPNFQSCTTFSGSGDWSSSASGHHHIPGQEATIEGSDDVYYVENGNFVQCLCPVDTSASGIQSNWWNVDGVDQSVIDNYKNQGWYEMNGRDWNLMDHKYLATNVNYQCHEQPTPTPTPTITTTPSPTPTGTTTPTPTTTPRPSTTPTPGPSSTPTPPPSTPPSCPDPRPATPTLLSVEKSGNDGVQLIWSEPDANVSYYSISYGHTKDNYQYGVPNTGKTTTFRIGSLDLTKTYYFVVRSQKGCAVSEASNALKYPKDQQAKTLADTNSSVYSIVLSLVTMSGVGITGTGLYRMYRR